MKLTIVFNVILALLLPSAVLAQGVTTQPDDVVVIDDDDSIVTITESTEFTDSFSRSETYRNPQDCNCPSGTSNTSNVTQFVDVVSYCTVLEDAARNWGTVATLILNHATSGTVINDEEARVISELMSNEHTRITQRAERQLSSISNNILTNVTNLERNLGDGELHAATANALALRENLNELAQQCNNEPVRTNITNVNYGDCVDIQPRTWRLLAGDDVDCNYYIVEKGDVMWKIAQAFNLRTTNTLCSLNPHVTDCDVIYVGDRIRVDGRQSSRDLARGSDEVASTRYTRAEDNSRYLNVRS